MPKPLTIALTQVYGSVAEDLKRRIGDAQAAQAGPPVSEDIVPATDEATVKAWNARRPEATDEAMQQMAIQKLQEHLQSGMPPEKAIAATAEDLTHFRYGERLRLYTYGQVDFKEQVAEAKRLKRLAERTTTPNPELPPPTMPTAALTNLTTLAPQLPEGLPPEIAAIMPGQAGTSAPQTPFTPPAAPGIPGMAPAPPLAPEAPTIAPAPPAPGGISRGY